VSRTTAALVEAIVEVQTGIDPQPFIDFASELLTDVCTSANPDWREHFVAYTDGYIGSRMELIERWLAAHFYTIFDNQLSSAKAGSVAVGYQYKIGLGLKSSRYGVAAMTLDTYRLLAKLDNAVEKERRVKVSVGWLGRRRGWGGEIGDVDLTTEM
jgi:hypothetical protein